MQKSRYEREEEGKKKTKCIMYRNDDSESLQ
jgi:hypothetical protein